MTIFEEAKKEADALKAKGIPWEAWQLASAGAEKFTLPDPAVYGNQADLYRKLSWVLLAVDLVASAGALTPFSVARIIAGKEPKDIPNHEFEMLLQHPNEMDSRFEFLFATIAYWRLAGNAYWWLNKTDEYAPPEELWIIPTQMIIPIPDQRMYLRGYKYSPGNGQDDIFLQPWEIVHFRRFNPFSRFVGLSAIEAIALVAQGDLGMQDWNTRLFKENNARLPGILAFKDNIQDPEWKNIKDETREASKKRELMMLRAVGEGGVNWLQNAVSQKDMEFLAGRKFNKEEIMTVLAPGSYSMLSENATQANAVVGRASFNELSVYPMHVLMAEKITNEILPLYPGRPLIGQFEDIRVTDKDMKLREQDAFAAVHTIEEIREEIYGDIPLGDERDKLIPIELTKQSKPAPTPSSQPPDNQPPVNNAKPADSNNQPAPPTQPKDNQANKAMQEDLARWQRKAVKKIGQAVEFESAYIPPYMHSMISSALKACKTEADVRKVFAKDYAIVTNEAAMVLEGLRLAIKQA